MVRPLKLSIVIVTLAMLIHTINGVYIEPRYLGFASPADYADPLKLAAASKFWSWKLSGTLHLLTGIALLWLTPALKQILRRDHFISDLTRYASLLASAGFVLTGILSIPGGVMANFAAGQNANHFTEVTAGWSIITYSVRSAAFLIVNEQVGLSYSLRTMCGICICPTRIASVFLVRCRSRLQNKPSCLKGTSSAVCWRI